MTKTRKRRYREALVKRLEKENPSLAVPGGVDGAMSRGANGSATMRDVDFLSRVREEMNGRNGYTGEKRSRGSRGITYSRGSRGSVGGVNNDPYTFNTHVPTEDGVFKCEDSGELTEKCPIAKPPGILIEAMMWDSFIKLTRAYDVEWIALLIGEVGKDSKGNEAFLIKKYYFPPQTASGAHVDVPTGVRPRPGTIGAIHSHVNMGVFWSPTDKDHSNWPVEIVINREAKYKALVRHKLRCGEFAKSEAEVYLTGSSLAIGVRKEMDKAFEEGAVLAKANRANSPVVSVIPPSVNAEDREDVLEALFCECGCQRVNHYNKGKGGCRICKECMIFKLQVEREDRNPAITTITPVGYNSCPQRSSTGYFCVREKGHEGYCKTFQGHYFNSTTPNVPDTKSQGSLGWPPFSDVKQLPLTTSSDDVGKVYADDPTVTKQGESDSPDEWDCVTCEGKGWVDFGGLTKECDTCNGDGMSVKGREEMSKELAE